MSTEASQTKTYLPLISSDQRLVISHGGRSTEGTWVRGTKDIYLTPEARVRLERIGFGGGGSSATASATDVHDEIMQNVKRKLNTKSKVDMVLLGPLGRLLLTGSTAGGTAEEDSCITSIDLIIHGGTARNHRKISLYPDEE